jgi:hypothetical protein
MKGIKDYKRIVSNTRRFNRGYVDVRVYNNSDHKATYFFHKKTGELLRTISFINGEFVIKIGERPQEGTVC